MTMKITVVGGTYGEECAFPRRQMYRGSGGRAAALLSSMNVATHFQTVVGDDVAAQAKALSQNLGYSIEITPAKQTTWFRYRFPLGRPEQHPPSPDLVDQPDVQSTNALVYGMVEGRPKVVARKVVYDPQDGSKSRPFSENGSVANELAQVVSWSEGRALTGLNDPEEIAEALMRHPGAKVVIVKCGPQGALVKTEDMQAWVFAYPTSNVYKIGSGDIFSASFAFAWIAQGMDPIEAAWFASRSTAHYVEHGTDRVDSELIATFRADAIASCTQHRHSVRRTIPQNRIYLAGPFFNVGQQWVIDETRGALKDMGFNVFSPIHDVGKGVSNDVASLDLEALDQSAVMLAILDGCDPGTMFEVGYARAKKIPVIAVAEDIYPPSLTMVKGSGCDVVKDLTSAIYRTCWTLLRDA